jgi:hypothetical protein
MEYNFSVGRDVDMFCRDAVDHSGRSLRGSRHRVCNLFWDHLKPRVWVRIILVCGSNEILCFMDYASSERVVMNIAFDKDVAWSWRCLHYGNILSVEVRDACVRSAGPQTVILVGALPWSIEIALQIVLQNCV